MFRFEFKAYRRHFAKGFANARESFPTREGILLRLEDPDGRVVAIRQDGWEIGYSRYFPSSSSQAVLGQGARPKLLMLTRDGLQIKLVIDSWNSRND